MVSSDYNPKLFARGIWERGTFTVPKDVSDERVQAVARKYKNKFGEALEKQGFEVLETTSVFLSKGRMPAEPGRKRYDCFARVRRKPIIFEHEIPDILIPEFLNKGFKPK